VTHLTVDQSTSHPAYEACKHWVDLKESAFTGHGAATSERSSLTLATPPEAERARACWQSPCDGNLLMADGLDVHVGTLYRTLKQYCPNWFNIRKVEFSTRLLFPYGHFTIDALSIFSSWKILEVETSRWAIWIRAGTLRTWHSQGGGCALMLRMRGHWTWRLQRLNRKKQWIECLARNYIAKKHGRIDANLLPCEYVAYRVNAWNSPPMVVIVVKTMVTSTASRYWQGNKAVTSLMR